MHYWLIKAAANGYLVFKLHMFVPFIDDAAVSDTTASKCSIHGFCVYFACGLGPSYHHSARSAINLCVCISQFCTITDIWSS